MADSVPDELARIIAAGQIDRLPTPLRVATLEQFILRMGSVPASEWPFIDGLFSRSSGVDEWVVRLGSAIALLDADHPLLTMMMERFHDYPLSTQVLLSPVLLATGQGPILPTLLTLLQETPHSSLVTIIQQAIIKGDLGAFNVVFFGLANATPTGQSRLGTILKEMGLAYCRPYLITLPFNPYRALFIQWFGQAFLDLEQEQGLVG